MNPRLGRLPVRNAYGFPRGTLFLFPRLRLVEYCRVGLRPAGFLKGIRVTDSSSPRSAVIHGQGVALAKEEGSSRKGEAIPHGEAAKPRFPGLDTYRLIGLQVRGVGQGSRKGEAIPHGEAAKPRFPALDTYRLIGLQGKGVGQGSRKGEEPVSKLGELTNPRRQRIYIDAR